jgi:hypothetical protein
MEHLPAHFREFKDDMESRFLANYDKITTILRDKYTSKEGKSDQSPCYG